MTILENMSLADNKGRFYGLGRGTNKARIDYYREQLAQLGLGLEDKLHVKVTFRRTAPGDGTADVYDDTNRVFDPG